MSVFLQECKPPIGGRVIIRLWWSDAYREGIVLGRASDLYQVRYRRRLFGFFPLWHRVAWFDAMYVNGPITSDEAAKITKRTAHD